MQRETRTFHTCFVIPDVDLCRLVKVIVGYCVRTITQGKCRLETMSFTNGQQLCTYLQDKHIVPDFMIIDYEIRNPDAYELYQVLLDRLPHLWSLIIGDVDPEIFLSGAHAFIAGNSVVRAPITTFSGTQHIFVYEYFANLVSLRAIIDSN